MPKNMNKDKTLLFDIEASNLAANFGYTLAIAWKWWGQKKVYSVSIEESPGFKHDPTCDKWLVQQFIKVLEQSEVIVGHYSTRFDIPYLQTRALYHQLGTLPKRPHLDTWRMARQYLKLNSNRLATVAAHLGLEEKTALDGPIWVKAMAGHKLSLKYVKDHCKQDVVVLEQVFDKLIPLRVNPPAKPIEESFYSVKQTKRGFSARKVGL